MTKTIQNGGFTNPSGSLLTGNLLLVLSQDAKVAAAPNQVAPIATRIPISAGNIAPTLIYFNDELLPGNTTYTATAYDAAGNKVYGPEILSLVGAGPLDLGTLVPLLISPDPLFSNPVLQGPAQAQTITGQGLTLTSTAPLTIQGSASFTNGGVQYLSTSSCTVAGIAAAIAAVGTNGTVHAEGCSSFTWNSTLTIANPVTLYLPCPSGTVTVSSQMLSVISDDVKIHGCGSGAVGQIANFGTNTAGTTYTASGLSASTDLIVVQKTTRATQAQARLSGFILDNFLVNMNSVGRRAVYLSSCWSCTLDHVVAYNANCSDGNIYQEADPASDGTLFAASYFMKMHHVVSIINQTNTTCHPFYFDASNGEIAYGDYVNLFAEGYPQAAGSGSDSVYINTGSTSVNQSFDQNVFLNLKTQDPSANSYGIKMQCRGNFQAGTNGRCFNVQFIDAQPERIFSTPGSGTAIGCVNGSGTADGTGCAFIANQNLSSGGWANNEDVANLGAGYMSVSDNSAVLQGPIFRQSGLHAANGVSGTTQFERIDPTFTPNANSQTGFSVLIIPNTTNAGAFTGASLQGLTVDMGDGTHTGSAFNTAYGLNINGFCTSWANTCWSLFASGPAGNHLDSFLEIGTASSGNPGGVISGGRFWYDQTNQQMSLSNNNGSMLRIPQVVASGTSVMGTSAVAATTCATAVTTAGAGVATTDAIVWAFNAAPPSGYAGASPAAGLAILAYVTSGNVNFQVCNPTAASITPAAATLNWRVVR